VFPLTDVGEHSAACLNLLLDSQLLDPTTLEQVVALLQRHPGPMPVRLCVSDTTGESVVVVSAGTGFSVAPSQTLRASLAALAGVLDVALASEGER